MKNIVFALVFLGAANLIAAQSPYCIRVYCIKQATAKIKNAAGHGAFFSAIFDSDAKAYFLAPAEFETLRASKGCSPYHQPDVALPMLHGTNAATLETLAKWEIVKPAPLGMTVVNDAKCKSMEKK